MLQTELDKVMEQLDPGVVLATLRVDSDYLSAEAQKGHRPVKGTV